jgi:aspartate 1-decarboxylase
MEAANLKKYEQVYVNNATNSSRIMTYVLPGERCSGMVFMNGGAALHVKVGDTVHVLTFCSLIDEELETFVPLVVFTDEKNQVQSIEEYI